MKELNIIVNMVDLDYLHFIKYNLTNKNKNLYVAICEINGRGVLSLATPKDEFKNISFKLKELISSVILYVYKEKFLIENINLSLVSDDYKNALIKALVLFDSDSDKQLIKNKIDFENDIYIDSLYNFKLGFIKKRWEDVCSLANDSNLNKLENQTFLDLLKFIIATIKPKANLIDVYFNGQIFELFDSKKNKIDNEFEGKITDEINLITTLISLAPQNINLHCINALSDETFKILHHIFDKKVNLLV